MQPVRVGVIGIGNMGWHHARVLSLLRDAELVGVADLDARRGQLAVEQFGCRWFPSYEELLGEVEAVCIAVPTLLVKGATSARISPEIYAEVTAVAPHVELVEVHGSDHHVTLDNPAAFVEVVQAFLKRHA